VSQSARAAGRAGGSLSYRLLETFEGLFRGVVYKHRDSRLGNLVAVELYEDLYAVGISSKFASHVTGPPNCVVNAAGKTHGVAARRGDGKFGPVVPGTPKVMNPGSVIPRGVIGLAYVGVEVKIAAKSQLKQIDRVITDLTSSANSLKAKSPKAITVGIAGVNYSPQYIGYEGSRTFPVVRTRRQAEREAEEVSRRLRELAAPAFDELVLLKFVATNAGGFPFRWVSSRAAIADYGAALVRISALYDARF